MIKGLSLIIHKIYYRWCHEKKQVKRRKTANYYYQRLREIIVMKLVEDDIEFLCGDIELDESYFGGARKGKRGRGAAGKVPNLGF